MLNLNEEEKGKKVKNSAHYMYDGEDLDHRYIQALLCFLIRHFNSFLK